MVQNPITGQPCVRGKEVELDLPTTPTPQISYNEQEDLLVVLFKPAQTRSERTGFTLEILTNAENSQRECVGFRVIGLSSWCISRGLEGQRLEISRILQAIAEFEGTPLVHRAVHVDLWPLIQQHKIDGKAVFEFPIEY